MKKLSKPLLLVIILIFLFVGTGVFYWIDKQDKSSQQSEAQNDSALDGPKAILMASDGTSVTARPFLVKGAKTGVVIVHDIDKDRSETMQFAEELAVACKCSTLALDLRGHGQSGGSKDDFTNMYQDALAAEKYLREQGTESLYYIGFGLGAHVALNAAYETKAPGLVIVSPDPDDRGLNSADSIAEYRGRLLAAGSETDKDSNRIASKLFNLSQVKDRQFAEYETGGHGIRMVYDTDLGKIIKDWLIQSSKTPSKE